MTNSKLNLGLILFLFMLFAGMTYSMSTPIDSCRNLTAGAYILTQDIGGSGVVDYQMNSMVGTDDFTACLVINESNTILDCDGHTIDGSHLYDLGIVAFSGNQNEYLTNVNIVNCNIVNYNINAITFANVNISTIDTNDLRSNSNDTFSSNIMECSGGINLIDSEFVNVTNNYLRNNSFGICLSQFRSDVPSNNNLIINNFGEYNRFTALGLAGGSYSNNVSYNNFTNNIYGLIIGASDENYFANLNVSNNKYIDFAADPVLYSSRLCNNYIMDDTIEITGGSHLGYINTSNIVINPALMGGSVNIPFTEVLICADNVTIENVYMTGDPTYRNNGLLIMGDDLTVNNLTSRNVSSGIYVQVSENITIQNSTFERNRFGIILNSIVNADVSNNNINYNDANGMGVVTSPALLMGAGIDPVQLTSGINVYNNTFISNGDGTSYAEAYPSSYADFLDVATGCAFGTVFATDVDFNNNYIYNSSTYGFVGILLLNSSVTDNEIVSIQNRTEFSPTGFFSAPEYAYLFQMLPGAGLVYDGSNSILIGNNISESTSGYITLPLTSLFMSLSGFDDFLQTSFNGNRIFDNDMFGMVLLGNDSVKSNYVYGNLYGLAAFGEDSIIFNNLFNNTNYFYLVSGDTPIYFNITEMVKVNIIGGDNVGGNYWGRPSGNGYSDTCSPNPAGFCSQFVLNGTSIDYLPLGLPSTVITDCVDLTKPSTYVGSYGNVVDYDRTFYIEADTLLCNKTYYTDRLPNAVVEGVYMYMNGSYTLDCGGATFVNNLPEDKYIIGVLNQRSDVVIKNCNLVKFNEGVVSSPPISELELSKSEMIWRKAIPNSTTIAKDLFLKIGLDDITIESAGLSNNFIYTLMGQNLAVYNVSSYKEFASYGLNNYYEFKPLENEECGVILYNNENITKKSCADPPMEWTNEFSFGSGGGCTPGWNTIDTGPSEPLALLITGDGSKLFMQNFSPMEMNTYFYASYDNGTTWSYVNNMFTMGTIQSLSMSSDGVNLVGVTASFLHFSQNSGYNWNSISMFDGSGGFQYADITSDGSKKVVSVYNGTIYTCTSSCDMSYSWGPINTPNVGESVYSLKTSGDGSTIVAQMVNMGGTYLYVNRYGMGNSYSYPPNFIVNFANNGGIAISNDGTKIVTGLMNIFDGQHYLFIYDVLTNSWTNVGLFNGVQWSSVSMTPDGQKMLASTLPGELMLTTNGGYNSYDWSVTNSSASWTKLDMSNDGQLMIARATDGPTIVYSAVCGTGGDVSSVESNYLQHPVTKNVYAYLLGNPFSPESVAKVVVYNITDGSELWNTTVLETGIRKVLMSFDSNNNVVLIVKGDVSGVYTFNYTNGELISQTDYVGPESWMNNYMFMDNEDYIYEFSTVQNGPGSKTPGNEVNSTTIRLDKYKATNIYSKIADVSQPEFENYTVSKFMISDNGEVVIYSIYSSYDVLSRLFISKDSGTTWSELDVGAVIEEDISEIKTSYDGKAITIRYANTIYLSNDTGATFTEVAGGIGDADLSVQLISDDGKLLYIASKGGNIYRSTDSGILWTNITSLLPPMENTKFSLTFNQKTLVLSKSGNVSISTNNGNTWSAWQSVYSELTPVNVVISKDGKVILLGERMASGSSYISINSGSTWRNVSASEPLLGSVREVSVSDNGKYIYLIAVNDTGTYVLKSNNTGSNISEVEFKYDLSTASRLFTSANGSINYISIEGSYYVFGENIETYSLSDKCEGLNFMGNIKDYVSADGKKAIWYSKSSIYLVDLDNLNTLSKEYIVSAAVTPAGNGNINVLFDGQYIYYTAQDYATGSSRLYYKVFNLNLSQVWEGEFKPNYNDVYFSSYLNKDTNNVEFLGTFIGNYTEETRTNFRAVLNKTSRRLTMVEPSTYSESLSRKLSPALDFVEIDSSGNTVILGYEKYPRVSTLKFLMYDTSGTKIVDRNITLNPQANMLPTSFIMDSDGNYLIGGLFVNTTSYKRFFIMKLSSTGANLGTQTYSLRGDLNTTENQLVLMDTPNFYSLFVYERGIAKVIKVNRTSLETIEVLQPTVENPFFLMSDLKISSDGTNACLLYTNTNDNSRNVGMVNLSGFEMLWSTNVGVVPDIDNIEINSNGCYYNTYYNGRSEIYELNSSDGEILGSFDQIKIIELEKVSPGIVYMAYQNINDNSKLYSVLYNLSSSAVLKENEYEAPFEYITPKDISYRGNRLSIIGDISRGKDVGVGYFVLNYRSDKFNWEKRDLDKPSYIRKSSQIVDMGNLGDDKYFAVDFIRYSEVLPESTTLVGTEVTIYELDSEGVYKEIFSINNSRTPTSYPLKTIKEGSNYYVLMGEAERINFLSNDDYIPSKYVVYAYTDKGVRKWVKNLDLYNFRNILSTNAPMAYYNGNLIVAGSKKGEDIQVGNKAENVLPRMSNVILNFISEDGTVTVKGIKTSYDFNFVQGVHLIKEGTKDGLLIVSGGVTLADQEFETLVFKTDLSGNVASKWPKILSAGEFELCSGNWSEMQSQRYDMIEISGDGNTLISAPTQQGPLFKSTNKGASWIEISPTHRGWTGIAISNNSQTIVGTTDYYNSPTSSILMSFNGGESWSEIAEAGPFFRDVAVSSDGQKILVGGNIGLYRCTVGPSCAELGTWSPIPNGGVITDPEQVAMSGDGNVIVAVQNYFNGWAWVERVYISTDLGNSWTNANIGFDNGQFNVYSNGISLSYNGSKILVIASNQADEEKAFISYDSGATWDELDYGGERTRAAAISGDGNNILVGDSDENLLLSTDGGNTWKNTATDVSFKDNIEHVGISWNGNARFAITYSDSYAFKGTETCMLKNLSYRSVPLNSFKVQENMYFVPHTNFNGGYETFIINNTGDILGIIEAPFEHVDVIDGYIHATTYDSSLFKSSSIMAPSATRTYFKLSLDRLNAFGFEESLVQSAGISVTQILFANPAVGKDLQPTSYGVLVGGSTDNWDMGIKGPNPINEPRISSGVFAITFKRTYSSPLTNISVENIGLFNDENTVLLDTSGSDANARTLRIGCTDFHKTLGARCLITFTQNITDDSGDGALIRNFNTMIEQDFVAIDSRSLSARPFNLSARVTLTIPGSVTGPFKIYRANGFYKTREDVVKYGSVYIDNPTILTFTDPDGGRERRIYFDVDGWSSYALGYTETGGDGPSGGYTNKVNIEIPSEMCIGETYDIIVRDSYTLNPLNDADIGIFTPILKGSYVLEEKGKTDANGVYKFTPEKVVQYLIYANKTDYSTNMVTIVPRDCKMVLECNNTCPTGFSQTDYPDCTCFCSIESCPEGLTLDGCMCVQEQIEPEVESNMSIKILLSDPTKNKLCQFETFTVEVTSEDDECMKGIVLTIPQAGVSTTINKYADLSVDVNGTFEMVASKTGCKTVRKYITVEDCSEDIFEPVIEIPLHEQLFNAINNIFRTSIKNGCDGFSVEGVPFIVCDLVWIIVIVGSIAGAYLEPLRTRKVIALFAPTVISIVLVPLAGAIGAGVVVYITYTSYKRSQGKGLREKEQMEAEIKK